MMSYPSGKPITDLYVQCSFDERSFEEKDRQGGSAMSDCCRRPASSAVVAPDGNMYWRCWRHEGQITADVFGPIRREMP